MTPFSARYYLFGLVVLFSLLSKSAYTADRYTVRGISITEKNTDISSGAQDQAGFVWYVSHGQLYRYDGHRSTSFAQLYPHNTTFSHIKQILIDDRDRIWLDTNDGLRIFDVYSWQFLGNTPFTKNLQQEKILALCQHKAYVYVATQQGNIWQINGDRKTSIFTFTLDNRDAGIPRESVCSADNQNVWFINDRQLYQISLKDNKTKKTTIPAPFSINPGQLIPLRDGLLLGNSINGYQLFDGNRFISWSPAKAAQKNIKGSRYFSYFVDNQIVFFFCDGTYSSYRNERSLPHISEGSHDLAKSLFQDRTVKLIPARYGILCSSEQGIFRISKPEMDLDYQKYTASSPFEILRDPEFNADDRKILQQYFPETIYCSARYRNNTFLIGTHDGIWIFNMGTKSVRRLTDGLQQNFSQGQIIRSLSWHNETLSYTCDNGYYEVKNNSCQKIYPKGSKKLYMYTHTSRNGKTYLATKGEGLVVLDNVSGQTVSYTKESQGISDNTIFSMAWSNDLLFLGTYSGLSILEQGRIYSANMQDGLPFEECRPGGMYLDKKSNRLYVGGRSGYMMFLPQHLLASIKQRQPPVPILAQLLVTTDAQQTSSIFAASILSDTIQLSNDVSSIALDFATIYPYDYKAMFRIYPIMEEFEDFPESGLISIPNLSAGEYKVEIQSMLPNGLSQTTQRWFLYKKSSFYETQLFYIILIITIGGLIFLALIEKDRNQKREDLLKEKLSKDLHDEVGGLLTGISMQADLLSLKPSHPASPTQIISSYSREAMQTMDDIIWSLNTANNSEESLEDRIKFYAHKMLSPLGIEVLFEIVPGTARNIPHDIRQNVFFIFKEAINNACKHGDMSVVRIQLDLQQNFIVMKVKNKMRAIIPDASPSSSKFKRKGKGISNMRQRAESIGATLLYGAADDKTTYIVQLKVSTIKKRLFIFK